MSRKLTLRVENRNLTGMVNDDITKYKNTNRTSIISQKHFNTDMSQTKAGWNLDHDL
jgi:hypothetical protein